MKKILAWIKYVFRRQYRIIRYDNLADGDGWRYYVQVRRLLPFLYTRVNTRFHIGWFWWSNANWEDTENEIYDDLRKLAAGRAGYDVIWQTPRE